MIGRKGVIPDLMTQQFLNATDVPFSAIRILIKKCGDRLETSLFSWPKEATKSIEADRIDCIVVNDFMPVVC